MVDTGRASGFHPLPTEKSIPRPRPEGVAMTPTQVDVAVVGSVNIDLVASVARLPLPGETVSADSFAQFPGGTGSNQAVAAARLGGQVAFVGLIGDDAEAGEVRSALLQRSVDVTHLRTEPGTPTRSEERRGGQE